jgi:hypothetical protein
MLTKIFQIYFDPAAKHRCDPAFTAYDNTANPNPKLQEWLVWDQFYQGMQNGVLSEELAYYVSKHKEFIKE